MMLVASGTTRSFCFAAGALLLLFGLIQVLKSIPPPHDGALSFDSLRATRYENGTAPIRIKKVSAIVGEHNYLYESALKTHEKHNEIHGYEMQVLRERIVGSFWAKPSYLLSLLVEEFAKPAQDRNDWIAWFDPATIILNPQVPLEVFLPPADIKEINLVASHDASGGIDSGVMFMRVSQWSLRLLVQILGVPFNDNQRGPSISKDQPAFEQVLDRGEFRGRTVFQPRNWFNAHHSNGSFEGHPGDLLVHCTDVNGEKWKTMDMYLGNTTMSENGWEKAYLDTAYEAMLKDFWNRIQQTKALLKMASKRERHEVKVRDAAEKLRYVMDHTTEDFDIMIDALIGMKRALKTSKRPAAE